MSLSSVASRDPSGYWVRSHPFYNPAHHRYSAVSYVQTYRLPVLRDSSVDGFFAITYLYNGRIIHTLLRQNADASIDIMTEHGAVSRHYSTLYDVFDAIGVQVRPQAPVPLPCITTPLISTPFTRASTVRTCDPIEVVVHSDDPTN
jgi:hypothetical protein